MQPTREQELALGLTASRAGEAPFDPQTKVSRLPTRKQDIYRPRVRLSAADLERVKKVMKGVYGEWKRNTDLLRKTLRLYNDRLEGIKEPKDFPWPNSSNLHIPLAETHMLIAHSVVTATVLDNDPIYTIRAVVPQKDGASGIEPMIERFLHREMKTRLKLDVPMSRVFFNAFRDPLAVAVLDWLEEFGWQRDVLRFTSVDELQAEFPDAAAAGVSEATYRGFIETVLTEGEVQVKVEERTVKYRGAHIREVELKDLVWAPVTAPNLGYCVFVGDQFMQRDNYFRVRANRKWFDSDETKKHLEGKPKTDAIDSITQSQDRIEGLARDKTTSTKEYLCLQGNLRIDLNGDDEEELYSVVFCPDTNALLRIEEFPYWHNRNNYIGFRIRPRSNRILGRCFSAMLFDMNEEVDTQHNQRIDSRTITTVPSFKKKLTSDVDFTRKDQRFYPGVTFPVKTMDEIQQFDIKQTDMGTSLQEETNLFQIAEQLTGATTLRSGRENPKDPRAPAKKVQSLISQSNLRMDSYIKELKPGMDEIGSQTLELYYQFSPDSVVVFADQDSKTGGWIRQEIERVKLRNKNMSVEIARSTVMDNPEQVAQRALVRYQTWSKEPLIGSVLPSRHALVKRTLIDTREKNIQELLPELPDQMNKLAAQDVLNDPVMPGTLREMARALQDAQGKDDGEPNGMRQGGPDTSLPTLTKGQPKP